VSEYIGKAEVLIVPDTRNFGTQVTKEVENSIKGVSNQIGNLKSVIKSVGLEAAGPSIASISKNLNELEKSAQVFPNIRQEVAGLQNEFLMMAKGSASVVASTKAVGGALAGATGSADARLAEVSARIGNLKTVIASVGMEKASPSTAGIAKDLQGLDKLAATYPNIRREVTGLQNEFMILTGGEIQAARGAERLAASQGRVAASSERASAATSRHANSLRGLVRQYTGTGLAATGLIIAGRQLAQEFSKWAETQNQVVQGLGQIAQGVTNLDLVTTGKGIAGFVAGLNLRGENAATKDATAALKHEADNNAAIETASKLLDLREQLAKAEGQVGTAAGRTKFQLEQQLRITQQQFNALTPSQKRVAAGAFGLNPNLSNKVAPQATDASRQSDFELASLRAGRSKSLANDKSLFEDRAKFLKGQIGFLENAGAKSQAAKDRLKTLYGQLDSVEGQLETLEEEAAQKRQERLQKRLALAQTELQIQAANARTDSQEIAAIQADAAFAQKNAANKNLDAQTRAGYQLQAAQDDKQVFDIRQQQAEAARQAAEEAKRLADEAKKKKLEELQAERQRIRSIKELRLQNQIAAAELTKGTGDDKKAIKANISYWQNIIRTTRGLQREQARANVISLRGQLQGLSSQNQPAGATTESFFQEAQSQFKTYGSNISGSRTGVLSGQDARARFAQYALQKRGEGMQGTVIQTVSVNTALIAAESVKQTVILHLINKNLNQSFGIPTRRGHVITIATKKATHSGGGN
jgi:hypothetical protein